MGDCAEAIEITVIYFINIAFKLPPGPVFRWLSSTREGREKLVTDPAEVVPTTPSFYDRCSKMVTHGQFVPFSFMKWNLAGSTEQFCGVTGRWDKIQNNGFLLYGHYMWTAESRTKYLQRFSVRLPTKKYCSSGWFLSSFLCNFIIGMKMRMPVLIFF